jgi:hypothetical protein
MTAQASHDYEFYFSGHIDKRRMKWLEAEPHVIDFIETNVKASSSNEFLQNLVRMLSQLRIFLKKDCRILTDRLSSRSPSKHLGHASTANTGLVRKRTLVKKRKRYWNWPLTNRIIKF